MTLGDLTPGGICAFEMVCKSYFWFKDVLDKEKVGRIAWGIQDPHIQSWYMANQEQINNMSFSRYMAELCQVWLPSDWERTLRGKVLSTKQGEQTFWEWVVDIQNVNMLLQGIASYLSKDAIHNQIEAN